jgi:hypothetical protein
VALVEQHPAPAVVGDIGRADVIGIRQFLHHPGGELVEDLPRPGPGAQIGGSVEGCERAGRIDVVGVSEPGDGGVVNRGCRARAVDDVARAGRPRLEGGVIAAGAESEGNGDEKRA